MIRIAQDLTSSSWAPVPQSYSHKRNADETLLTSWQRTGPDRFLIKAGWPGDHSFYTTGADGTDPLLFSETVRQCLPVLSHAAYDVPLGHHLLWETYDYSLAESPSAPRDITLHIDCTDISRRGTRAGAATAHIRALHGDSLIGTATTRFTIQTPAVYRRLRGEYADVAHALERRLPLPAPLPEQEAGRERPYDVVLSPTDIPGRHQLRVDTGHPVLFDHPVDHVPGILLLDAARQAAHAASRVRPVHPIGMTTRFFRYVEFDAPCWIETAVDPAHPDRLLVTAWQNDKECFTASVALAATQATPAANAPHTGRGAA
ncbi:ScbA/BarX family gamma-butyrolactone biosynthesis protein [Streptomyces shaanxiensis]|uniref:Gamma-butyrolactone biosynthesis protein ScbA n=1 Tax=Streptomyces shaanxiensis TaxID=653357 RepID=A0ABP7URA9_9ACTN